MKKLLLILLYIGVSAQVLQAQYLEATMTNNQNILTVKLRAKPGGGDLSGIQFTQLGFFIRQPVSDPAITFGTVTSFISGITIPPPDETMSGGYRYYQFESQAGAPQPNIPMIFPDNGTSEFPVFSVSVNGIGTGTFQLVHNGGYTPAYLNLLSASGDLFGVSAPNVFYGNISNEAPDFHLHTLSSVSLPLELLTFEASRKGDASARLQWETEQERNVSHFDLERSLDGVQWSKIAKIAAQNQSNGAMARYEWTDENVATQFPSADLFYYRLQLLDRDGASSYAPVRSVGFDRQKELSIYPNPFQSRFFVQTVLEGPLQLRLYDAAGRLLQENGFESEGRAVSFETAQNLPAGSVLVEISDAGGNVIHKERLVHVKE